MTKGVIYYSDCRGDQEVLQAVRDQIVRAAMNLPVVSATLQPATWFASYRPFVTEIVLPLERGYVAMFRQILAALEASTADVVFHCEHDVLYHPSHFGFVPPRADTFYYNQHVYKVDAATGQALHYRCNQVSGLCASRELLVDHYRRRVAWVEAHGFERALGFEPGTNKFQRAFDDRGSETWWSPVPNVDVRTGFNLTKSRWSQAEFRNKSTCQGWTMADAIPGWGVTKGRFREFLADVQSGRVPQKDAA